MFDVFYLTEAADWLPPIMLSAHQISVFISLSGRFGRIFCSFSMTEAQFPCESTFPCACFRFKRPPIVLYAQSCPPAATRLPCECQRRCTWFRQLRPGLDPPQVVVHFLCAARALHRCRPHRGKFLSDKVFPFLILAERPSSLHERCLYPVLLAPHYRSSVWLDSQFRPHTLSCKSEALCHRMERKQLLHPAHLTLLKRWPIEVIQIELRESNIWCYISKIPHLWHGD